MTNLITNNFLLSKKQKSSKNKRTMDCSFRCCVIVDVVVAAVVAVGF